MTTEEKVEAYDVNYKVYTELINRLESVKSAIKEHNYGIAMDILYKPYPEFQITTSTELKESDDERIRKALIRYFTLSDEHVYHEACGVSYRNIVAWLEKQGEQKHADEVEPKFKVGDWIVSKTSNLVYRVDSILYPQSKCYYLSHNGGIVLVSFTDEQNYRLWTIKDAKDGDVLITENKNIFIFKSINDYTIYDYCGLYFERFTNSSGTVNGKAARQLPTNYVPATKEQRDLLFQKMKEAGYEWDAEKKELKKIHVIDEGKSEMDYCFTKTMTSEKVSPAWSKEDDIYIENIILAVEKQYPTAAKDIVDWLKSLKNRINNF